MRFDEIEAIIGTVPIMPPAHGKVLYDFILTTGRKHLLELGFAHGTSTCYMAAALDERGEGHITTIDLTTARENTPDIHSLLRETGLTKYVTPIFAPVSYNWELKRMLEEQAQQPDTSASFDFCFLDGLHEWTTDGFAFFLVEKLLTPGGWLLFDDLDWSYTRFSGPDNDRWPSGMPKEYRDQAHIERVFSLLVTQHPSFEHFRTSGSWGWAQKKSELPTNSATLLDQVYLKQSIARDLKQILRKIYHRFV